MADILRDTFDEGNRFAKVIYQRNKNILDSELNEAQDNLRVDKYRSAYAIAGDGSPDAGLAVQANGGTNTVTLTAGTFQASGYHLLFPADLVFNSLTTNPGPGARTDILYMAVSESEVADPLPIAELGETTRRRKVVVQFAVAEGDAIPQNSELEIWQGGTRYVALASLLRPAGNATMSQSQVTDLRGLMPGAALKHITQRNALSARTKVIVNARNAEGLNDAQIAVRAENGTLPFSVDRIGNITAAGVFESFKYRSVLPAANDTYDLGASDSAWRALYVGRDIFLGDTYTSQTQVQGDVRFLGQSGTPGLQIDGISGHVAIGGDAFAPEVADKALIVHGNAIFYDGVNVGSFGAAMTPDTDDTHNIGSASNRWHHLYAARAFVNDVQTDTLRRLAGTGGQITAYSSLIPSPNNSLTLGATNNAWSFAYVSTLRASAAVEVGTSGSLTTPDIQHPTAATAVVVKSSLNPDTANTLSLGTATLYWQHVYSNNIWANMGYLGGLQLTGNMYPGTNATHDLGTASQYFANVRSTAMSTNTLSPVTGTQISVNANITSAANQSLGTSTTYWHWVYTTGISSGNYHGQAGGNLNMNNHVVPVANTYNLGSTTTAWNIIYGTSLLLGYTSVTNGVAAINGNLCVGINTNNGFNARLHVSAAGIEANNVAGASAVNSVFRMIDGNQTVLRIMNWRYGAGATTDTVDQYLAKRTDTTDNGFLAWYGANGREGQVGIGLGYGTPGTARAKLLVGAATTYSYQPFIPDTNNTHALGSAGNRWSTVYCNALDASNFALASDFLPSAHATYNLGNTSTRWNNVYLSGAVMVTSASVNVPANIESARANADIPLTFDDINRFISFVSPTNGYVIIPVRVPEGATVTSASVVFTRTGGGGTSSNRLGAVLQSRSITTGQAVGTWMAQSVNVGSFTTPATLTIAVTDANTNTADTYYALMLSDGSSGSIINRIYSVYVTVTQTALPRYMKG